MRTNNETGSNIFLTGCILLANMDFAGLLEYALKAAIGGGIWLGYKAAADWLASRKKRKQVPTPTTKEDSETEQ
jgi:hypothetical protein